MSFFYQKGVETDLNERQDFFRDKMNSERRKTFAVVGALVVSTLLCGGWAYANVFLESLPK